MVGNSKYQSFAFFIALGRILAMLVSFVMPIFMTRFFSKSDYGIYCQFFTISTFLYGILSFGIQTSLYYHYPNAPEEKKETYVFNVYLMLLFFSLLSVFFLLSPASVLIMGDSELLSYRYFIAITVLFMIPNNIIAPLFSVRKDSLAAVLLPPAESVFRIVIVIVAVLVFRSLQAVFVSSVIYQLSVFLFVTWYTFRGKKITSCKQLFNFKIAKEQLKYSLPFGIAVLLQTLLSRFDKLLCINFLSEEEYAIYSIAFFGIPGIMLIYSSLSQVNVMDMSTAYKNGKLEDVLSLYKNFTTKTISFSLPIITVVALFSHDIILFLFSEKYLQSVPFFRTYIFYFIFAMLGAGTVLRAVDRTKMTMKSYIISMFVCLPMIFLGVKYFGMWGALVGSMIGSLFPKFINIYFEQKVLKVNLSNYLPWKNFSKIFFCSIIPLFPVAIIYFLFNLNIYLCALMAIVYILLSYYFEMRFEVFVIDKQRVVKGLSTIYKKITSFF